MNFQINESFSKHERLFCRFTGIYCSDLFPLSLEESKMKKILLFALLVLVAGILGLARRGVTFERGQESRNDIIQTYQLAPGARIEVTGIVGTVQVDTSDRSTADVEIAVIGHSADDTKDSIALEQTADGLVIRGHRNGGGFLQRLWRGEIQQNVYLKAPTNIQLVVKGVNGRVSSGVVDGKVQISGINGQVSLAKAGGYSEISGVNGGVSVGVKKLDEKGLRISGVNGGVVLHIAQDVNADLNAHGINGKVRAEAINLNIEQDHPRSRFSGKIGSGGAPINISGVNGGVKLVSDDQTDSGTMDAE